MLALNSTRSIVPSNGDNDDGAEVCLRATSMSWLLRGRHCGGYVPEIGRHLDGVFEVARGSMGGLKGVRVDCSLSGWDVVMFDDAGDDDGLALRSSTL